MAQIDWEKGGWEVNVYFHDGIGGCCYVVREGGEGILSNFHVLDDARML